MNKLSGAIKRIALYDNGKRLTEFDYDEVKEKNDAYILWNKNQVVLFDKKTMTKRLEINDNICCLFFQENYFIVRILDGTGFNSKVVTNAAYSYDGKVLIAPYKYTDIYSYEQVIIAYSSPNYHEKYMYNLDGKGLIAPSCSFEDTYPERKGILVKKIGKYGFYSYKGELLIPIEHDNYQEVSKLIRELKVEVIDETLQESG